jgi:DNA-binding transcriptional ArsR family regulator
MSRPGRSELIAKRGIYAPVFAALGDPTRLSLVAKLCGGAPCSISTLTEDTQLTRQAVTKHLRVLQQAHLVHSVRTGRESRFALNPEPIEAVKQYLDLVSKQWDDALDRLCTFVES